MVGHSSALLRAGHLLSSLVVGLDAGIYFQLYFMIYQAKNGESSIITQYYTLHVLQTFEAFTVATLGTFSSAKQLGISPAFHGEA